MHGKLPKNIKSIIKKKKVELVICVGEIPKVPFYRKKNEFREDYVYRFHKHYKKILEKLDSFKVPVFILKGNETGKGTRALIKKFKNLTHKYIGSEMVKGRNFIFFDYLWEERISNARNFFFDKMAKRNPYRERRLNKLLGKNNESVLISHAPPHGYLDVVKNEYTNFKKKHVGSKILLKAIKEYQPPIVFCGHIHEAKGKAKIGKTKVYNLGERGYIVMDLDKNKILRSNFLK